MGVVQFISNDDKIFYGTTQFQTGSKVSITPRQIIGLIPVDPLTDDCRGDVCIETTVLDGDLNRFLFQWSGNTPGLDDYRLEIWDGSAWNEFISGNPLNTLGSESGTKFTFGSFPAYPFYSGFWVDWGKIFAFGAGGPGTYRFKVVNSLEPLVPLFSPPFVLKSNTCENRDNTVYIELSSSSLFRNFKFTKNNNAIQIYNTVDIANGWPDSNRYSARFDQKEVETETRFVKRGSGQNKLHYVDDFIKYNLKLYETSLDYLMRLKMYGLESHDIKVTDGNSDSFINYDQIPVINDKENEFESFVRNRKLLNVNLGLQHEYDMGSRQC